MELKLGTSFIFLLVNALISQIFAQIYCATSRLEPGICTEIRQCPRMLNILKMKPLLDENVNYLRKSQCDALRAGPAVVIICCPLYEPTSTVPPVSTGSELSYSLNFNLRSHHLLPSDCGEQTDDRILGGERTDIDEFPWLVLLEYQKGNKFPDLSPSSSLLHFGHTGINTGCGGVLINKRYVLTAAHCVKNHLVSVRLGEYDKYQKNDCIITQAGYRICTDPPVSIFIEEKIIHEGYIPLSKEQRNDIALLRLVQDVIFTDFIKPICLPEEPKLGQLLNVAGWGITESGFDSNVKLKLKIPLVGNVDCNRIYRTRGITLGAGQFCAGGQKDKDSCKGDSGGPIMSRVRGINDGRPRWVSIGVVSFGPLPCGQAGWPGVYTKVYDFVPWILRNLKP